MIVNKLPGLLPYHNSRITKQQTRTSAYLYKATQSPKANKQHWNEQAEWNFTVLSVSPCHRLLLVHHYKKLYARTITLHSGDVNCDIILDSDSNIESTFDHLYTSIPLNFGRWMAWKKLEQRLRIGCWTPREGRNARGMMLGWVLWATNYGCDDYKILIKMFRMNI